MPTVSRRTLIATSTKFLHENIGRDVLLLADASRGAVGDREALGRAIVGCVAAAVKAVVPGRQSAKQVKTLQQQAQQAFARRLARKAKAVG